MRMLGDVAQSHCPSCHCPPGPDCPDVGKSTRAVKRREQRALAREFAMWSDWYDTDEGRIWLNGPLLDVPDCQHGCNGDCLIWGGSQCNFTCHEVDIQLDSPQS